MSNKYLKLGILTLVVGVAIGLSGCGLAPQSEEKVLGGIIHNVQESFDAGIAVKGTEVISDTRDFNGDDITADDATLDDVTADDVTFDLVTSTHIGIVNGTVTTTIRVGSGASTSSAKLCLWNGASYTLLSYPSNSVTLSTATSTACS